MLIAWYLTLGVFSLVSAVAADEGRVTFSKSFAVNGERVAVSYSLGAPPSDAAAGGNDYVGLFVPATADPAVTAPVRVLHCIDDPAYKTTGTGTLHVRMLNQRADVAAYLLVDYAWLPSKWSGWPPVPYVLEGRVASPVAVLKIGPRAAPQRPRIAPSAAYVPGTEAADSASDTLAVSWTAPPDAIAPQVWYWSPLSTGDASLQAQFPPPGAHVSNATMVRTFTRADLCTDAPFSTADGETLTAYALAAGAGWVDPGATYTAVLTGLREYSGTALVYAFGDAAPGGGGMVVAPAPLRVPPLPGRNAVFTFAAAQDWGTRTPPDDDSRLVRAYGEDGAWAVARAIANDVAAGTVHAVLSGGDSAYADGFIGAWEEHAEMICVSVPFASSVPTMLGSGNHDDGWVSGAPGTDSVFGDIASSAGECGTPLTVTFPQPSPWSPRSPWYATQLGPVCFLVLATELPLGRGSPQRIFAETQLRSFDRRLCPHVVVSMHRPMWIRDQDARSPSRDVPVMQLLRRQLDALFAETRVTLVLSGHNHRYMRSCVVSPFYDDVDVSDNAVPSRSSAGPSPSPRQLTSAAAAALVPSEGAVRVTRPPRIAAHSSATKWPQASKPLETAAQADSTTTAPSRDHRAAIVHGNTSTLRSSRPNRLAQPPVVVKSGHVRRQRRRSLLAKQARQSAYAVAPEGECAMRGVTVMRRHGANTTAAQPVALYCDPPNAVHAVVGAAGAKFDVAQPPLWFVDADVIRVSGYARVSAISAVELAVEYVEATTGVIHDRFAILHGPGAAAECRSILDGTAAATALVAAAHTPSERSVDKASVTVSLTASRSAAPSATRPPQTREKDAVDEEQHTAVGELPSDAVQAQFEPHSLEPARGQPEEVAADAESPSRRPAPVPRLHVPVAALTDSWRLPSIALPALICGIAVAIALHRGSPSSATSGANIALAVPSRSSTYSMSDARRSVPRGPLVVRGLVARGGYASGNAGIAVDSSDSSRGWV